MSQIQSLPARARPAQQAYVIELGEAQIGLVSRRADERDFTFVSASAASRPLEAQRSAPPGAAEPAARGLSRSQRRAPLLLAS